MGSVDRCPAPAQRYGADQQMLATWEVATLAQHSVVAVFMGKMILNDRAMELGAIKDASVDGQPPEDLRLSDLEQRVWEFAGRGESCLGADIPRLSREVPGITIVPEGMAPTRKKGCLPISAAANDAIYEYRYLFRSYV